VADEVVAVVGAGTMGTGIARMLLAAGLRVSLSDVDADAGLRARRKLEGVAAGSGWPSDWAERLSLIQDVAAVDGCEVVLDATPQNVQRKVALLATIAERVGPGVLVGTVTLGTPLVELDPRGDLAGRLLGFHFMNPPHALRFCELVVPDGVAPGLVERAHTLLARIEVGAIVVPDTAGFVLNRALVPFLFTAVRLLEGGVVSAVDIDRAFVEGCGHPMGPLAIIDLIGIDVAIALGEQLYPTVGETCRPPGLLYTLLTEGRRLHDVGDDRSGRRT
jgi:3-hydroxybutyryl-CoA dehydrogenase